MPIAGDGYEILGVSVFGDGPLAHGIHMPLDPGVTALYGLNGAGKTRLLRAVSRALTGVAPPIPATGPDAEVHLHLRLGDPFTTADSGFVGELRRSVAEGVQTEWGGLTQKINADDVEALQY